VEPESIREPLGAEGGEAPPPARNFFSRLGGVYTAPREAFTEIGRAPRLLVPIIVAVILGLGSTWYITRKVDLQAAMEAQLEDAVAQGRITAEQMEQQLALMSNVVGKGTVVMGGVSTLLLCLVIAGFMKLFSLFAGAENRFRPLLAVSLYTTIAVSIVTTVLMAVVLQFKQPGEVTATDLRSVITSNLGSLLEGVLEPGALPKFVMGLARGIDIFNIWMIALLAIGAAAVSRKLKTSTAALWLGCAYAVIIAVTAAIGSIR
jgi:uncharacterized membrane protein YidH (DUF202 family)